MMMMVMSKQIYKLWCMRKYNGRPQRYGNERYKYIIRPFQ